MPTVNLILSVTILKLLSLSPMVRLITWMKTWSVVLTCTFWSSETPLEFVLSKTWTPISIFQSGIRAVANSDSDNCGQDDIDVNECMVIDYLSLNGRPGFLKLLIPSGLTVVLKDLGTF